MEFCEVIRVARCERAVLHQPHRPRMEATLAITSHHLIVAPRHEGGTELWVSRHSPPRDHWDVGESLPTTRGPSSCGWVFPHYQRTTEMWVSRPPPPWNHRAVGELEPPISWRHHPFSSSLARRTDSKFNRCTNILSCGIGRVVTSLWVRFRTETLICGAYLYCANDSECVLLCKWCGNGRPIGSSESIVRCWLWSTVTK